MIYYRVMDELIYRVFPFTVESIETGVNSRPPRREIAEGNGANVERPEISGFGQGGGGTNDGGCAIKSAATAAWIPPRRNNRIGWWRVISWKYSVIPGAVPFPRDKIRRTDFTRAG